MTDQLSQRSDHALADHLAALNLAGLSYATKRLLGSDPSRVSGQFTMWARQELQGLPSLTTPLWAALDPLQIGRPKVDAAAICDKVLRGRHGDPAEATAAAAACGRAGKMAFATSPPPSAAGSTRELAAQRKALIAGVKDYWRALGAIYGEVRSRVVTGEYPRAARMVAKAQSALEPTLQQIAMMSASVAAPERDMPGLASADVRDYTGPAPDAGLLDQPPTDQGRRDSTPVDPLRVDPGPSQPEPAHETEQFGAVVRTESAENRDVRRDRGPRRQPTPLGDREQIEAKAEAFARSGRVRDEDPVVEPVPVEVLSTKPVRNRVFAPVLFVIVVAAVALLVIFTVLNGPNPLAN